MMLARTRRVPFAAGIAGHAPLTQLIEGEVGGKAGARTYQQRRVLGEPCAITQR